MAQELGHNIKVIDKEDRIIISIKKSAKLQDTKGGKSKALAKTTFFERLEGISGDKFEDSDLGLNLFLTVRPKKEAKKAKPDKPVKRKKARLDDDDEE